MTIGYHGSIVSGTLVVTSQTAHAQCTGSCGGCVPQQDGATGGNNYEGTFTDRVIPIAYDPTLGKNMLMNDSMLV